MIYLLGTQVTFEISIAVVELDVPLQINPSRKPGVTYRAMERPRRRRLRACVGESRLWRFEGQRTLKKNHQTSTKMNI